MKTNSTLCSLLSILSVLTVCSAAHADQKLRVQVNQRGDFLLVGNTLGWDCAGGLAAVPLPVVGSVPGPGACGFNTDDSSVDVFWRADEPATGAATADLTVDAADARSTSFVDLPAGALVTHAFLYWGARRSGTAADTGVVFERPGVFTQAVTALSSSVLPVAADIVYQSVADVTSLVRANGAGAYRVSGIEAETLPDTYEDVLFAGWAMVVLYQLDTEPPRNLAVFDGLDNVDVGQPSSVSLSGFLVPNAGFDAKLGTIVYEGDDIYNGDSLLFGQAPLDQSDRLSDALNPVDNFFNGTRSLLGVPVSKVGDLPQLSGLARTMAGLDLDVVDVTSRVHAEQTSVDLQATSALDHYFLGAFVTSISTFRPDFNGSTKTVRDVNGGALLAGEQLEYTITVSNLGNDASTNTVMSDVLPAGVTLVPGSIQVTAGANLGTKTEAMDADQASYDPATRTLKVTLGDNASASTGGSIPVAGSSVVVFLVTVDPTTRGVISNQGKIEATGARGAPTSTALTDGNSTTPGSPTTDIPVAGCQTDANCGGTTPICDATGATSVCVQCSEDKQCPGPGSTCDLATHTCHCRGLAMSCMDSDGDGLSDPDETAHGTDPADADSDDDGVPDGAEQTPFQDTDGDGLINALDPDSDDDALFDGTESGYGCSNPGTNAALGHCRADADAGATRTDPSHADTDTGGARDGAEDTDLNGRLDADERDPTTGHAPDDASRVDSDADGLSDPEEATLGSDPRDRDSDDDGLLDGDERNPSDDTDGDGLRNVLDVDSDNDGLYDGTESGKSCADADTKPGHCTADGDAGATTTSPVKADTDGGGARDGSEDVNRNGVTDSAERDPTVGHAADDSAVIDSDGDGLSDDLETGIGSNPHDADSDDDGVRDGAEANFADDTDGDGKLNVLDPDSDGDGLVDGTERGSVCDDPATDASKLICVADADAGQTKTSMVAVDTDHGGVPDAEEDENHNGAIDPGERDPNNPADDHRAEVLDAGVRDAGATDASAPIDLGATDGGIGNDYSVAGGGCGCTVAAPDDTVRWSGLLGLAVVGLFWSRRQQRRARSAKR
ncbi:MAG: putative cell surface protein [Myxococcaceae bacterium]|nr:putative cell surface protein [Myxococcaceae bacterium]